MKTLLNKIVKNIISASEAHVAGDEVVSKFNEIEKQFYSLLPPVPQEELTAATQPAAVISTFVVEDFEIFILQKFSSLGLTLRDVNTEDLREQFSLEFVVKLRNQNDANNLRLLIHQLKFDLGDGVDVKLFKSKSKSTKTKMIKIHVSIQKNIAVNVNTLYARV